MQLYTINTGYFKLDGGAMFGLVPKVIWHKLNPADDKNLCTWAMRCLLIEKENRLILIDTGLGNKQSEKFFSYFEPHGNATLQGSLKSKGFSVGDITDVILTHLHFDHAGGAVSKNTDNFYYPTFPNAVYWSHSLHWAWASHPNAREKASYLKENFEPLTENCQVKFIDEEVFDIPEINFLVVNGHTEAQIIPKIKYRDKTVVFCADLLPSPHHIPLPYIMSYDIRPLVTLDEKTAFLQEAHQSNYILFYEHDPHIECSTLQLTEKGVRPGEFFNLSELK